MSTSLQRPATLRDHSPSTIDCYDILGETVHSPTELFTTTRNLATFYQIDSYTPTLLIYSFGFGFSSARLCFFLAFQLQCLLGSLRISFHTPRSS